MRPLFPSAADAVVALAVEAVAIAAIAVAAKPGQSLLVSGAISNDCLHNKALTAIKPVMFRELYLSQKIERNMQRENVERNFQNKRQSEPGGVERLNFPAQQGGSDEHQSI
eukprot:m.326167 g.326167  ORF g.326167 m.326167 type:complete len:111 (-) comp19741_c0_seq17:129-461(-)